VTISNASGLFSVSYAFADKPEKAPEVELITHSASLVLLLNGKEVINRITQASSQFQLLDNLVKLAYEIDQFCLLNFKDNEKFTSECHMQHGSTNQTMRGPVDIGDLTHKISVSRYIRVWAELTYRIQKSPDISPAFADALRNMGGSIGVKTLSLCTREELLDEEFSAVKQEELVNVALDKISQV